MAQLPPSGQSAEPPKRRNIGGRARKFTINLQEWWDAMATWQRWGFEQGYEWAREDLGNELRAEIEAQVRAELVDPDCPLCIANRDIARLTTELTVARADLLEWRNKVRGRVIREGTYPYRQTR